MATAEVEREAPQAVRCWIEDRRVYIELADERAVSFPASKFPPIGLHRLRVEQSLRALAAQELIALGGGSAMASTATDRGKEYLLRHGLV